MLLCVALVNSRRVLPYATDGADAAAQLAEGAFAYVNACDPFLACPTHTVAGETYTAEPLYTHVRASLRTLIGAVPPEHGAVIETALLAHLGDASFASRLLAEDTFCALVGGFFGGFVPHRFVVIPPHAPSHFP